MVYEHLTDNCLARHVGDSGLSDATLARLMDEAAGARARLRAARDHLPLLALPHARDDLPALEALARELRDGFDRVLVLGTGGSSLGARTLIALAPPAERARLIFLEDLDPNTMGELLASADPARSAVLAVSKSGGTLEALAPLLILLDWLEAALGRNALAKRVWAITEPGSNVLRRLAAAKGFACLDHDPNVGGRFSVLSNVGLLPAMIAGLDGTAVRKGAAGVLTHTLENDDTAPALGAAISVGLAQERGIAQSVLLCYAARLGEFGYWFRQLWAESLGKEGHGTTPIRAMGPVDQHSQLQLYLDGPADKMFTLIALDQGGQGPAVARGSEPDLAYLEGRHLGDMIDAMARATAETLAHKGRPVRVFKLTRLDEEALGALLMHFMLETILAADLLGVNAFDQPAVEDGKVLARQYLSET
ncbi:MAG: glucose-6-phosphate isomerase [Pseudomonadota bacterium]